jgi:hypothetical protein
MRRLSISVVAALAAACLVAPAAHAYIGPGAGLTAIGTVIALLGGIVLGIVGFVWYPIKRLLRRRRPHPVAAESPSRVPASPDTQKSTIATTPKQKT